MNIIFFSRLLGHRNHQNHKKKLNHLDLDILCRNKIDKLDKFRKKIN